jgi:hypothetical protein
MKRFFVVLALVSSVALATTFQKLTLEQQVERAQVIVRATIGTVTQETRGGRPWTVYALTVKTALRGEASALPQRANAPSIAVLGGTTQNGTVRLEGAPAFKTGEDWLLMLYTTAFDSPVVGFRQGAYRFDNAKVLDIDGKSVTLEVDGKRTDATEAAFLKTVTDLIGGRR